jgi:hypothetical protein
MTTELTDMSGLIVMTTLHPVLASSGLCGKGFIPEPAGQIDPAQAVEVPSNNMNKNCTAILGLLIPTANKPGNEHSRFISSPRSGTYAKK